MTKIHTIADAELGGILREYVETDRIANVGDYVANGRLIGKLRYFDETSAYLHVDFEGGYYGKDVWYAFRTKTLSPTDIVHVEGTRLRMVERKAAVGERVVVIEKDSSYDDHEVGMILTAELVYEDGSGVRGVVDGKIYPLYDNEYRVLEPLQSVVKKDGQYALYDHETDTYKHAISSDDLPTVDATQASPQVLDMLANLAQRIVALEKAQEKQAEPGGGESAQVFPNIPTFKVSDLHGKTLRIYSAQDIDSNIIATTTIGVDEATGQAYVIANETEVIE